MNAQMCVYSQKNKNNDLLSRFLLNRCNNETRDVENELNRTNLMKIIFLKYI